MTIFAKVFFSIAGVLFFGNTLFNYPDADAFPVAPQYIPEPEPAPLITPLTVAPTTTVVTTIANCDDLVSLAASVGWPIEHLQTLKEIARRESGVTCAPTAFNADDPNGGSYGSLQINGYWCLPNTYWPIGYLQAHGLVESCDDLFNATTNLRSALAIFYETGSDFSPWGK
jgi:hypothetical protein